MNEQLFLSAVPQLLAVAVPLLLHLGAFASGPRDPFRAARWSTALALGIAPFVLLFGGLEVHQGLMLLLVGVIGFVITRYAEPYLEGEAGQLRFARALLLTLGAVAILVVTSNLGVLAVAWMGSSLALHQLLTHRSTRPQALVAAHKKFLVSRLADATIAGAVLALYAELGTLDIGALNQWAATADGVPLAVHGAMVLLVFGVALKSAQLPFHGWLIQVMEAPTPVSALLHAGVVNIGGFVLIRLAAVLERTPVALFLLVAIGLTTTVVAAAVMSTQRSVKVTLAWSTCAQMGLMLVECGLGAWHLALLHLLAHSAYKAHAFLSAGSAVDQWVAADRSPARGAVSVLASLGALVGVGGVAWLLGAETLSVLWVVAVGAHLASGLGRGVWSSLMVLAQAVVLVGLTFVFHAVFLWALPTQHVASPALAGLVVGGFLALYLFHGWVAAWPMGRVAGAVQPHLYAGLYLDEAFTRITFRWWPPRLPPRTITLASAIHTVPLEA